MQKREIRASYPAPVGQEVIILDYFTSKDPKVKQYRPYSRGRMILEALQAFWGPLALIAIGADSDRITQAIEFSASLFQKQIDFLKSRTECSQSRHNSREPNSRSSLGVFNDSFSDL